MEENRTGPGGELGRYQRKLARCTAELGALRGAVEEIQMTADGILTAAVLQCGAAAQAGPGQTWSLTLPQADPRALREGYALTARRGEGGYLLQVTRRGADGGAP